LYKRSTKVIDRKPGVLYYDCTNYFFEIEQEEGLKQYGYSKEHKPNPIVQMGLFMYYATVKRGIILYLQRKSEYTAFLKLCNMPDSKF